MPIKQKIHAIATEIYGAADVSFSEQAEQQIATFEANGFGDLPICMAKTHLSLSHDPRAEGRASRLHLPHPRGARQRRGRLYLPAGRRQ